MAQNLIDAQHRGTVAVLPSLATVSPEIADTVSLPRQAVIELKETCVAISSEEGPPVVPSFNRLACSSSAEALHSRSGTEHYEAWPRPQTAPLPPAHHRVVSLLFVQERHCLVTAESGSRRAHTPVLFWNGNQFKKGAYFTAHLIWLALLLFVASTSRACAIRAESSGKEPTRSSRSWSSGG